MYHKECDFGTSNTIHYKSSMFSNQVTKAMCIVGGTKESNKYKYNNIEVLLC